MSRAPSVPPFPMAKLERIPGAVAFGPAVTSAVHTALLRPALFRASLVGSKTFCMDYCTGLGNLGVVQELLDRGADVHTRNSYEETALDVAVRGGHVDVVQALIDEKAPLEPPQNKYEFLAIS
uniref:ANK_REP_REGION domain-containing protein n=1 Tax=Steinernema glaseri TaxID=37863 RepID=A0A1I8AP39_9BILA